MSQQKRRDELQDKRKREEAAKKEEAERIKKQNVLKGTVQAALKNKFGKSAEVVVAEKTKEAIARMRKEEKEQKERLQAAIKRGRSGPMLLEKSAADYRAHSNIAFLKATQKMV